METTVCTASMVVFTELRNSDVGTFKHSDSEKSSPELASPNGVVHKHIHMIIIINIVVVNEEAIWENMKILIVVYTETTTYTNYNYRSKS